MVPYFKNINEILPHIEGRDEFIVVNKGWYTVINYVVLGNDTFNPQNPSYAYHRECRGIIFETATGRIINRRFQKFFNLGEREDIMPDKVDFSRPHMMLEKLDGSMVSACFIYANADYTSDLPECKTNISRVPVKITWMTKMGETDTSKQVVDFVKKNPKYWIFARSWLKADHTPIFEWVSNKNRIVLDYPDDNLILTAIRDNRTGHYISYDVLCLDAKDYDIPVVKAISFDNMSIDGIVKAVREQEGTEGIVIRFDDGEMYKIKGDWYIRIHKVKSMLESEKDAVGLILRKEIDDLLPVIPENDRKRVEEYSTLLIQNIKINTHTLEYNIKFMKEKHITKKSFALSKDITEMNSVWKSFIFRYWEESNPFTLYVDVIDYIINHSSNNKNFAIAKEAFFPGVKYEQS